LGNTQPVASAGEDETINPGAVYYYFLDGTGSGDVDVSDTLLYSWELIDAPVGVDIGSFIIELADTVKPYFETNIKQGNYK
jgi:hypothetical protein